jgi:hypothetical protein
VTLSLQAGSCDFLNQYDADIDGKGAVNNPAPP